MDTRDIELQIITLILADAFAAGYVVSVKDGHDWVLRESTDQDEILGVMFTSGHDVLSFKHPHTGFHGWVKLVYGNGDGSEVVADSSPALQSLLDGATNLADELAAVA
ncbi:MULTISPECIES: hypothetical protein [Pseudomonas]|uniref:hypothetical protein n=1 Tax=Pseudomonas TaxID=286 RepID=UPI00290E6683|nr:MULTISPECIES: hypothetical protein [Pseudomonas]MDU8545712.1 hypothetical protein [Pseudomonas syringae group sp. J248-6]WPP02640.1 hypothetical protein SFA35_26435 [Pseudomonas sp. HR96]